MILQPLRKPGDGSGDLAVPTITSRLRLEDASDETYEASDEEYEAPEDAYDLDGPDDANHELR